MTVATKPSTGWATLQIDVSDMTKEQREALYKAEGFLRQAGISFDTGQGCGARDWELDWSLGGATLSVRSLRCMNSAAHDERLDLNSDDALWSTDGRRSYCSAECRKTHEIATRSHSLCAGATS